MISNPIVIRPFIFVLFCKGKAFAEIYCNLTSELWWLPIYNDQTTMLTADKLILLNALLASSLFVACKNPGEQLSAEDKKTISATITNTLNDYYKAIKDRGLIAEFNYLDSSADFYWQPPGYESPVSYDSVSAFLQKTAPVLLSVDNSWQQLSVHPLTKELASYSGRIKSAITEMSGKQSITYLLETGIVIKRKDGWKLLSGQTSIINK